VDVCGAWVRDSMREQLNQQLLERIKREVSRVSDFPRKVSVVVRALKQLFPGCFIYIHDLEFGDFFSGLARERRAGVAELFESEDGQLLIAGDPVTLPVFIHRAASAPIPAILKQELVTREISALSIVGIGKELEGFIAIGAIGNTRYFSGKERKALSFLAGLLGGHDGVVRDYREPKGIAPPQPQRLLYKIFENAVRFVVELNQAGEICWVNRSLSRQIRRRPDKILGSTFLELLSGLFPRSEAETGWREVRSVLKGDQEQVTFKLNLIEQGATSPRTFEVEAYRDNSTQSCFVIARELELYQRRLQEEKTRFERVVQHGHLIILRANGDFRLTRILGDTAELLGIEQRDLLHRSDSWRRFIKSEDYVRLIERVKNLASAPEEFEEEVRFRHRQTGKVRWLMLKAVPLVDERGSLYGWEGFGIDITEKKQSQAQLESEQRRLQALYEVSKALRITQEPALVTLRGLKALIRATNSDSGFGCFFNSKGNKLELVAAEGLSAEYVEGVSRVLEGRSLVREAIEGRQGLLIANIQDEERAAIDIARMEDVRSTIIMPLLFEDQILGAIVLFCHSANRYSGEDFALVSAAASQIALSARQAESFLTEKKQADSFAVLYRLSHELSKLLTPAEVAEHAFPVVQEELACKRMWLGVINESRSHIIGQGGIGPGVRESIKNIQIELGLQHDFLDEAIKHKKPVLLQKGQSMVCSGLDRLITRLDVGMLVIIPLISLGQVVGVFILEPRVSSPQYLRRKLPLLGTMATEIATVLLARRFETKMADADKMRMAAVLASGVAHNFNNLLQAVMGQASLIEMQLPESSPLRECSQMIIDAAGRGASLVKHLLSFSSSDPLEKRHLVMRQLLEDSKDLYASVLGGDVVFEMDIEGVSGGIFGDGGQIQQIVTNLLVNSREAIGEKSHGVVSIKGRVHRLRSGEVDPELAPGLYLRLDIRDNGRGMDKESIARCFEPFYSTKQLDPSTGISLTGSGLGLSSAYSIARQHGGTITVASALNEGTTFSIYLPISESRQESSAKESKQEVLIIDQQSSVAYSIQATLESFGLSSQINPEIHQALKSLESKDSSTELVIIDLDRYSSFAAENIEKLRKQHPAITFVLATIDRVAWQKKLRQSTGVVVIDKPISVWSIQSAVREFLPGLAAEGESKRGLAARLEKLQGDADQQFTLAVKDEFPKVITAKQGTK